MQAHGAITFVAQAPGERGDWGAGEGMIGVEAIIAEIAFGDAGQYREFGSHRVGAPARDFEPAESRAVSSALVKARQQVFGHAWRHPARIKE